MTREDRQVLRAAQRWANAHARRRQAQKAGGGPPEGHAQRELRRHERELLRVCARAHEARRRSLWRRLFDLLGGKP